MKKLTRRQFVLGLALGLIALGAAAIAFPPVRGLVHPVVVRLRVAKTVDERVTQYGPDARHRMEPRFEHAGVAYPPSRITLVGLKDEAQLEVWAAGDDQPLAFIHSYPIAGASGGPGPKLREGDRQVPEGIYAIESLNPNSRYHLSMKVGYPNASDRANAKADGRTNLGGNIFIHGGNRSIGCLAMGDPAAEELFVMLAETGIEHCEIVIAPVDLRRRELPIGLAGVDSESWLSALYGNIAQRLAPLER